MDANCAMWRGCFSMQRVRVNIPRHRLTVTFDALLLVAPARSMRGGGAEPPCLSRKSTHVRRSCEWGPLVVIYSFVKKKSPSQSQRASSNVAFLCFLRRVLTVGSGPDPFFGGIGDFSPGVGWGANLLGPSGLVVDPRCLESMIHPPQRPAGLKLLDSAGSGQGCTVACAQGFVRGKVCGGLANWSGRFDRVVCNLAGLRCRGDLLNRLLEVGLRGAC